VLVRFAYLLLTQCLSALLLHLEELVILRDHINHICGVAATCTKGNKAYAILAESSIVKMARTSPREAITETHLHVGKARGLSTELSNWDLGPCEGLQRGLGEA
jgi:hypothetical protein